MNHINNGLKVIHKNNYIHHDMKPSNIILNFDLFKISDFGISNRELIQYQGTPMYYAP
jgi:serine/threonine protein kinase